MYSKIGDDKKSCTHDIYLKAIALNNVLKQPKNILEIQDWLKRWWCRYYKRPYKDPLLENYSLEELMLEYYENMFLDNPNEREKANADIQDTLYGDEDEEELKQIMGDKYISKEEMMDLYGGKSKE